MLRALSVEDDHFDGLKGRRLLLPLAAREWIQVYSEIVIKLVLDYPIKNFNSNEKSSLTSKSNLLRCRLLPRHFLEVCFIDQRSPRFIKPFRFLQSFTTVGKMLFPCDASWYSAYLVTDDDRKE